MHNQAGFVALEGSVFAVLDVAGDTPMALRRVPKEKSNFGPRELNKTGSEACSLTPKSSKYARAGLGTIARIRATLLLVSATVSEQI